MNASIKALNKEFFYPNHHVWKYCYPLGKFTDSKGRNYDLGICVYYIGDERIIEAANVFSNKDFDYSSAQIDEQFVKNIEEHSEHYQELVKRMQTLKII